MSCCGNKNGCCKNNQMNQEEYEELKDFLSEEIIEYRTVDYMDKDNEHKVCIEVEFEEYVLELEDISKEDVNLDYIVDIIIKNHMK